MKGRQASIRVRPAKKTDLRQIAQLERACFPAQPWDEQMLARYECLVAVCGRIVVGFLFSRTLFRPGEATGGEYEILNVAVDPGWRRKGIAKALLHHQLARGGQHFLEVRASNEAARKLYQHMGFEVIGTRPKYYSDPEESAIVMRWKWC